MADERAWLEEMIRKVVRQELGLAPAPAAEVPQRIDASGVIAVDPRAVALEEFPFPIECTGVKLKDVLTLEQSPRLGCGIMELEDGARFEWTLSYDEVDYVIEGTLEILIDGRKVSASPGEIVFIPKNTTIHFSTPNRARFMYVCYPANWADQ